MSQINPEKPSYETMQQAVEWFVVLNDEDVTEQDRTNWNRWLQEPQHAKAWKLVENVHQRFSQAEHLGGKAGVSRSLKAARKDRISRRRLLQTGSALGLLGWLSWQYTPIGTMPQRLTADYASQTGEVKPVTLRDGGELWLNTASAVNIKYTRQQRVVELLSGEILIQTGADQLNRPFSVSTAQGSLRALGTQFAVRDHGERIFVAVYEGAVEIQTLHGQSLIVKAGQQTTFSDAVIEPSVAADPARKSWSEGIIVANDIPLHELVAELNRYQHGYLNVAPDVANLTIMGTFPVDQPEHALSMLEDSLPVAVHYTAPWWISIERK